MLVFKTKELETQARNLGFTSEALAYCLSAVHEDERKTRVRELRACVKERYRLQALKTHPDLNNGDCLKSEEFKRLSLAYSSIEEYLDNIDLKIHNNEGYSIVSVNVRANNVETTVTTFSSNWWDRTY